MRSHLSKEISYANTVFRMPSHPFQIYGSDPNCQWAVYPCRLHSDRKYYSMAIQCCPHWHVITDQAEFSAKLPSLASISCDVSKHQPSCTSIAWVSDQTRIDIRSMIESGWISVNIVEEVLLDRWFAHRPQAWHSLLYYIGINPILIFRISNQWSLKSR